MYVLICLCMSTHTSSYIYIYIYMYMYIHNIYTHIYIYICVYTYVYIESSLSLSLSCSSNMSPGHHEKCYVAPSARRILDVRAWPVQVRKEGDRKDKAEKEPRREQRRGFCRPLGVRQAGSLLVLNNMEIFIAWETLFCAFMLP